MTDPRVPPVAARDAAPDDPPPGAAALAGLALGLGAAGALMAAALALPGQLAVQQLGGDMLHLLDGLARIRLGQIPNVDFSTPLGPLGFLPIAMWDAPPARALAFGQATAAAAIIPFILWLARTRLSVASAFWLGAAAMLFATAAAWSATAYAPTMAMHYNRWAWALFLATAPILLLTPRRGRGLDLGDGAALGLAGAALLTLKVTYLAFLAPAALMWAALWGRWRALGWAMGVGLAAAAAIFVASAGWSMALQAALGYAGDLWSAARSDVRPAPGMGPLQLATTPAGAPVTLALVAAARALQLCGLRREALMMAAASLSIVLIAWQNFGNAMMGALVAAPVLAAAAHRSRPGARFFGAPAPTAMRALALWIVATQAPTLLAFQRSLFSGWAVTEERHAALFADAGAPGIFFEDARGEIRGQIMLEPPRPRQGEAGDDDAEDADEGPRSLAGRRFNACSASRGFERLVSMAGAAIASQPALRGRTVLTADLINPVWWAAGAPPQKGAQLWAYAPLGPALETMDLLAVSTCPAAPKARNRIIDEIAAAGIPLRPALDLPHWTIFERVVP
ncbi:hypothetical protein [Oceanicella actignis]|uniref:DUF2029 domain-containing protein n=1 Tax=Oceanicella actignis TaxID=1189325 RepID=A0A1M7TJZ4_9RHOB|nr:hypothetical protein [Oceanicella actignis]SET67498.1 hypothetical protein SAMN04488119_10781 [Oceanicella actignis]SHN71047.1 hypothetical protein SAMN05216200_10780 [Oceanicella actignis]